MLQKIFIKKYIVRSRDKKVIIKNGINIIKKEVIHNTVTFSF